MKIITTHSHLLTNPTGLDEFAENGPFSQVWMLQLPEGLHISEEYSHPASEAETLDVAKRFPGFLLPFKWVDFRYGPEQIDRAVDKGFVGFKGIYPKLSYDDERYYPIYERIASYHSVMVFHTGYVSTPPYNERLPELGYQAANMRPAAIRQIAMLFPEMNVVAAHFGLPWERELLDSEVTSCPNLYIDLSGGHWTEIQQIVEQNAMLPAALPDGQTGIFADHFLFGADAYIGHPQLHEDIKGYCQLFFDFFQRIQRENAPWADRIPSILGGNAERIMRENRLYNFHKS